MKYLVCFILVVASFAGIASSFDAPNDRAVPESMKASDGKSEIDFNRDVRPILSDRCFLCHGPDQASSEAEETDLRLDDRDSALDYDVFDFDDVDESELILRVLSDDPGDQMPPEGSGRKPLTADEVDVLRRWIEQGAEYDEHWAYQTPVRPDVPLVNGDVEPFNEIDSFVLSRLSDGGLAPAQLAERETLIRRASLDLTGLPPTVEEVDAFINDAAPIQVAFEKVVDRLLESDAYGEHMARYWLDAARYADTSGYQYDRERTQWVWRDWVIHAFNTNKPFDEFTIEQIAGDLLPDATDQTRLATGFNRNHPITIEGGVIDEEYRTEYVIDRVVTTGTVWLGQTLICARCHDHKYDPVSQRDFYSFYAYFNNVPERGLNGFDPQLTVASPLAADQVERLAAEEARIRRQLASSLSEEPVQLWEQTLLGALPEWSPVEPDDVVSINGAEVERLEDGSVLMKGPNPGTDDYEITFEISSELFSIRLDAIRHESLTDGSTSRGSNGNFVLTEFVVEVANDAGEFEPVTIASASADYEQNGYGVSQAIDGERDGRKGWAVDGNTKNENRWAVFDLAERIPVGSKIRVRMFQRWGQSHQIGRFRLSASPQLSMAPEMAEILSKPSVERSDRESDELQEVLISSFGNPEHRQILEELNSVIQRRADAESFPATMVMKEMGNPREAYVLERGEYDKPNEDVHCPPGVPGAIGEVGADAPANRLGLARWLVSREQPLTARVTVNRFWQQLFGTGLVKTSEDFGFQGEYPSHPDLLDWLAVEFMETGWDVKQTMKLIVMSRTYQQSSHVTPELLEKDPDNRLLARGPSSRLDGEVIRDCALAVGGLLDRTIGGPGVYPYHPEGLWLEINNRPNFSREYPHQKDVDQHHRRSLYTFWKRTVTPPSVGMFDAPSREYCVVRRSRTNTPLQALVMLHDPQFVEAAKFLAARMINEAPAINEGGAEPVSQIEFGFRLCTSRRPTEAELAVLTDLFATRLRQYEASPELADEVLAVGLAGLESDNKAELAAMTRVAQTLLNLSEFLTRE
ncbi:MAG: PSD1 and planctomycete cytochrome C domain-containing protein [Planctomycetota bacterium]